MHNPFRSMLRAMLFSACRQQREHSSINMRVWQQHYKSVYRGTHQGEHQISRCSSVTSRRSVRLVLLIAWLSAFQHGFAEEYRAGTARAKITPTELGWLGGYGHRNRP